VEKKNTTLLWDGKRELERSSDGCPRKRTYPSREGGQTETQRLLTSMPLITGRTYHAEGSTGDRRDWRHGFSNFFEEGGLILMEKRGAAKRNQGI